jgi:hypothetical protein
MNAIAIQKESFSDALCQEILPLAQKCWDEGTALKGETCAYHGQRAIVIEPDFALYGRLAEAGTLVLVTARYSTKLVGYIVGYLYQSPHHKKMLVANGDSIYIEPEYRGHAASMIEVFLADLKARGALTIGWPVSQTGPVYDLLRALGFVGDEIIMEKLICA